ERPLITCLAFGYKNGAPADAALLIDARFLDNPYWVPELRPLTGRDPAVVDYVMKQPAAARLLDDVQRIVRDLLPLYQEKGRMHGPYGTFTSYVAFDRTDEGQLAEALKQTEPDVLLDLACYQPHEVTAVARHFKGERYIFVSTGVYPDLHGKPAREEDFVPLSGEPPEALDYREGKRWCETALARLADFPWTVIRPPAVFGPADHTLRIAAYI